MTETPNILVVCGRNKRRSRTAEYLYKNDARLHIRSVGLSPKSERQIKQKDVDWADLICVMEDDQGRRIGQLYRQTELPPIEVLQIPDDHDYLDPELIEMIKDAMEAAIDTLDPA